MDEKARVKDILEWIYCIIIAVVLAILVRHFIGTPTIVKQPSMYPTLKPNQRLILNRWYSTVNTTPKRGEIITFEAPSISYVSAKDVDLDYPVATYGSDPDNIFSEFVYHILEIGKTSYIKRVIGLPGEHVQIQGGKVYINGKELEENYLQSDVTTTSLEGGFVDLVVPENTVFVMGDNRAQSTDSRRFGCVPVDRIESKVWIRFWPLNVFGKVD